MLEVRGCKARTVREGILTSSHDECEVLKKMFEIEVVVIVDWKR